MVPGEDLPSRTEVGHCCVPVCNSGSGGDIPWGCQGEVSVSHSLFTECT